MNIRPFLDAVHKRRLGEKQLIFLAAGETARDDN